MNAKITLSNGTEIIAEKNADCYITASKPEFPDVLGKVIIESEDGDKEYEDALLIECACIDNRYWFSFMETPEDIKLKNRIEELETVNGMLEECILEMSEIIYA